MTTPTEDMDLSQYKHSRHESSYAKLDAYRKDGTLYDITLKSTDGNEIRAHKCVLVSNSEYFEKMFIGRFQETTQDVIQIKDISSEVLQNLIDFMYTGVLVQINQDNIDEMLFGAELFLMNDVRDECISYYKRSLSDENCLTIKEIADIRGMTKLSEECFNYALQYFNDVVQHQSFLDADVKHLTELLKNDDLNCKEEEAVYRAVIKWIKHDEAERKHLLPGLLKHVRLIFMLEDCLLKETKTEPLIYTNPHCMHCFKKVFNHFHFKYGDSLKKIITNVRPRKHTTNLFQLLVV
ncbi:kelch-like protein 17 isoform X2 [Myzus persicae]|uniref:kelch-like protein 17 isoform X2 n=1 Tax=Myzus persicae TaxID=13164 RepID=UPI000B935DF9|nr:kelch-like protein 17 isoform X2 [Myzus persicae]